MRVLALVQGLAPVGTYEIQDGNKALTYAVVAAATGIYVLTGQPGMDRRHTLPV